MSDQMMLTDETYKDFIKEGRVVIRTWDEGCSYCAKYEPIFNEYIKETGVKAGVLRIYVLKEKRPSEFKRAYMKQDKSENIKETVPGTFVFENGELKARHFGIMTKEHLAVMVSDFTSPAKPLPKTVEEFIVKASVVELQAAAYQELVNLKTCQKNLSVIEAEIERRHGNGAR